MPRIISFAWTTPALLAGAKTCTRRDWAARYAAAFKPGDLCTAYDRNPRAKGKPVATIRIESITSEPEPLYIAPPEDYASEGFEWFDQHPDERDRAWYEIARGLGLTVRGASMYDLWLDWIQSGQSLYVVRFELIEVMS